MKTRIYFITLLLWGVGLFPQNYLDVIRPYRGMRGISGAESGVIPTAQSGSNALLGNPALLSYTENTFISTDLAFDQIKSTSVFNSTIMDQPQKQDIMFNSIAYIRPVSVYRGAWVWGFSLQPISSFSSISRFNNFDPDEDFSYQYQYQETGNLYALTGGSSVLVTMNTSLGFAVSYFAGKNSLTRIYEETDPDDNYLFDRFIDSLRFEPRYSGFGARIGMHSELTEVVKLGISVELPSRLSITESSSRDSVEWYGTGEQQTFSHEKWSGIEYAVWGPWRLGIGLGVGMDPLEASVNYRFHSYNTTSFKGDLYDASSGEDLENVIDEEITRYVQNVHEFSASLQWILNPLALSFGASLMNDPLNYRFDNIIRLDMGVAYQFTSGMGFTLSYRNEQWQSDINHTLENGVDRSVEVENKYAKLQIGMKYIL